MKLGALCQEYIWRYPEEKMKPWQSSILFVLLLIGVSLVYDYHNTCFERPQSVHKWRQADCASIALNYHQGGMDFTHPQTHNLTSDGGTTGANCTSEVPILYYSVAGLYRVFGYNEATYRIFNALLFFLGLFYLFKAIRHLIKDVFWAASIALLFFTSPLLVYYGNSFLSNSTALSFSFIGWYFFIRYYFEGGLGKYHRAMLFFGLAACFKITALFSPLAIGAVGMLEILGMNLNLEGRRVFKNPIKQLLPLAGILALVGGWVFYASAYNQAHGSTYFSTTIFPIWDLSGKEIKDVISEVLTKQQPVYFHAVTLVVFGACFLYLIARFKQFNRFFAWVIIFVLVEIGLYAALQFWTFADHDYYTINMFILPVLLVIACADHLKRKNPTIFSSIISKVVLVLLVGFNVYHAKSVVDQRYEITPGSRTLDQHWMQLTPVLAELGITAQDSVIALTDDSHASLYWMNVKGWTNYIDTQFNKGEKKYYNKDREGIEQSISNGARYLILNGKEELYTREYLTPFCTHLMWSNDQVFIFDLKNPEQNYYPEERDMSQYITCGAEQVEDGFFKSDQGDRLDGGQCQSESIVFEGEHSCRLGPDAPYAMTYSFKDVNANESFEINVWRFGADGQTGQIVATCPNQEFYNNSVVVVEKRDDGWEKASLKFLIPDGWNNEELKLYLHDSSGSEVFFDELVIVRSTP
jgi:hypothetical protein